VETICKGFTMITFELLGDSNVIRNWKTVSEYYEPLKNAISRSTTSLSALKDNLKTVSQTTECLVVASLTNPLTNISIDNIDAVTKFHNNTESI
jgi:hypothetical protein